MTVSLGNAKKKMKPRGRHGPRGFLFPNSFSNNQLPISFLLLSYIFFRILVEGFFALK
jgi:hypothetical protein